MLLLSLLLYCIKYTVLQVKLAEEFSELVEKDDRFELPVPPVLGLVCFRLKGDNDINERLCKNINEDNKIHITPSKICERFILRFAVCSRFTVSSDVSYAWQQVQHHVQLLDQ